MCYYPKVRQNIVLENNIMTEHNDLTASDVANLSIKEIDAIQTSIDKKNMATIYAAYKQGKINEDELDYLQDFYHDGMSIYREVYRSLYETFGSPIYTTGFNPETGEVDVDKNGQVIDHSLRTVTPFVYTKLKLLDKNNNAIFVIFPKMKSAERAIEKLDKEFGREYFKNVRKAIEPYFTDEDPDKRAERLQNIPKTTSQLHDILRLTITCKYLYDVKRIMRKFNENKNNFYFIKPEETRDRFEKPLDENEKQYYDIKMIMHQKTSSGKEYEVELQLKLDTLFYGDIKTHAFYEKRRQIEGRSSPNDPPSIKHINEEAIKIYDNLCKKINQNAIHQYNMMVMDKVFRTEDNDYRALRIAPDNKDGTYNRCINFIMDNYMIESYDDFDAKKAFATDDMTNKACYLKIIGALPPNFDELSETAPKQITEAFDKLDHAGLERFKKINEVARRYQKTIQKIIDKRKKRDNKKVNSQITCSQNINSGR